jgi:hypothetical protein
MFTRRRGMRSPINCPRPPEDANPTAAESPESPVAIPIPIAPSRPADPPIPIPSQACPRHPPQHQERDCLRPRIIITPPASPSAIIITPRSPPSAPRPVLPPHSFTLPPSIQASPRPSPPPSVGDGFCQLGIVCFFAPLRSVVADVVRIIFLRFLPSPPDLQTNGNARHRPRHIYSPPRTPTGCSPSSLASRIITDTYPRRPIPRSPTNTSNSNNNNNSGPRSLHRQRRSRRVPGPPTRRSRPRPPPRPIQLACTAA